ncbi:MAG: DUF1080 domain-containing protein [Planctomycetia bacterium]|nr:DUF1080 domain-containing protein [Planctomycetia bacterium]NCG12641.1 DUF1080 domain-containing protein [Planctomycetia bacterium]
MPLKRLYIVITMLLVFVMVRTILNMSADTPTPAPAKTNSGITNESDVKELLEDEADFNSKEVETSGISEHLLHLFSGNAEDRKQGMRWAISSGGDAIMRLCGALTDRSSVGSIENLLTSALSEEASRREAIHGLVMTSLSQGSAEQRGKIAGIFGQVVLENRSEDVSGFLLNEIALLGSEEVVPQLLQIASSTDNTNRAAVMALGAIPGLSSSVALAELLKSPLELVMRESANAISQRQDVPQESQKLLLSIARSTSEEVSRRDAALEALIQLGNPDAMTIAMSGLKESSPENRGLCSDRLIKLASRLEETRYESYALNYLNALLISRSVPENRKPVIRKLLERCRKWTSIYDGKSSEGWIGDISGYEFGEGEIQCREGSGGEIYTASEYSDFLLRFEFKLWPGSNNGLGLRTPSRGNAAYVGMECQIIDNSFEKYANLNPYQYHGSIYGVQPASRGAQKPVGEWNFQEVRCQGRRVTVVLNGKTILDIDIDAVSENGTLDGKDHPGLKRTIGHIGFLGHNDPVAFRNLRVLDLSSN